MFKWICKFLILVAVATIVGHNTLPHHHHVDIQSLAHHEDESTNTDHHEQEQSKKDDHNIFSFAQLDDDFVPGKYQKLGIDLPLVFLLTPVITYQYNLSGERSKVHFNAYREYPPPGGHSFDYNRRGPPPLLA